MSSWYALYTRSNYEKRVAEELERKGIESYVPMFKESRQWTDRRKIVEVPVFRSYAFTRFVDTPSVRRHVRDCIGVVRIVGSGDSIEPVRDQEIEALKQMLAGTAGRCLAHPLIREGSWVRVKQGPLKSLEGLLLRIKNQTRLVVSITLLSKSVSAEVEAADVEFVRSGPAHNRRIA